MPTAPVNGLEIYYEQTGPEGGAPIVLIMGLGAQMTLWPDELVMDLAGRGFRVTRFDNRDIGLSQKLGHHGLPDLGAMMAAAMMGGPVKAPYTLHDMAADAAGLMDHLGIAKAHWVGASMGGMIAQILAATRPERTQSLVSIMSSTGRPGLPPAEPHVMAALMTPPPSGEREVVINHLINLNKVIGSPGYPADLARARETYGRQVDRSVYPEGSARQMAAIVASTGRHELTEKIAVPTLVIHGADDALVPLAHGQDTANSIKGARIEIIPGMGHDLPLPLVPKMAELIAGHVSANA